VDSPDGSAVTAKHWDRYVEKHITAGSDSNRAEWMAHPVVQRYRRDMSGAVSEAEWLVSGFLGDGGVKRAIGIGVGHGMFELGLLDSGAVESFDLYDLSPRALDEAHASAARLGLTERISTHVADISEVDLAPDSFGLATFYSSLHHVVDLEGLVPKVARALQDDGVLFASEYIGPNRFAYGEGELGLARDLFNSLDKRLLRVWKPKHKWRRRLRGLPPPPPRPKFHPPDPVQIAAVDPTEAVHSAEILATLRKSFRHVHITSMGGALALPIWPGLDHDYIFDSQGGVEFVEMLIELDRALTESGRVPSYFALIAATDPLVR
jgi:SAM-dependent methyltransferase